jgi:hypothetical protein
VHGDPLCAGDVGDGSKPSNFAPTALSPAIDAGSGTGLTSDYFGNPIYGTPDIGAIEYQPPYVMGTDPVDVSADVRVYADGKFRNTAAPSGTTAILAVGPQGGWPAGDCREWMNIGITEWQTAGTFRREWTERSPILGATATTHAVGGLDAGSSYAVSYQVDAGPEQAIGTFTADGGGAIAFEYAGGYAGTVRFVLEQAAHDGDDADDAGDDAGEDESGGCVSCAPGAAPAARVPALLLCLILAVLWRRKKCMRSGVSHRLSPVPRQRGAGT